MTSVLEDARDWQRLSPRMLLVHPVRTLGSFAVPIVLGVFGVTRGDGDSRWAWIPLLVGAVVAVLIGVGTWFTTRYRFTDAQLQKRTGLLSRRVLTAPLDRIRSVDVESGPIHRLLGLAKVQIGTGVDSSRIDLDGLTTAQATQLRTELLRRGPAAPTAAPLDPAAPTAAPLDPALAPPRPDALEGVPPQPGQELARIDWSWLRFAPFSLSSLVVVAGAFGVLAQFGDDLPIDQVEVAEDAWAWIVAQALLVLVAGITLLVALGWVLLSTLNYVLAWWNLRVVREPNGTLRVTRGLLTTRSRSLERAKVRGVTMGEPFLLRLVRGAELKALATGVGMGGQTQVLPPAPRAVVERVGHALLEEDGPLTMPLVGHGPRARRRIHGSKQWGSLVVAALLVVPAFLVDVWIFGDWPWWVPLAALAGLGLVNLLLAESAWRNLGHGLTERHLIVQTGAVIRTREVLEQAGIIGWSVEQSFFQRRLGLADLVATTAVGSERVAAPNIPYDVAVRLAARATPGMLEPFAA